MNAGKKEKPVDIQSPGGIDLRPREPEPLRLSKRAGMITLLGVGAIVVLILYGIYLRNEKQAAMRLGGPDKRVSGADTAARQFTKDIPAGPIAPGIRAQAGVEAGDGTPPLAFVKDGSKDRVGPSGGNPAVAQPQNPIPASRELSAEERLRLAAYTREREAVDAPTGIGRSPGSSGAGDERKGSAANPLAALLSDAGGDRRRTADSVALALGNRTAGVLSSPASEYELQNQQERKEAFPSAAGDHSSDNLLRSTRTPALGPYMIRAGWDIPAVLEQALNSDLPGEIRALVTTNVYDTATGRYLLIPHGSRLVGTYDSHVSYGQNGLQVVWYRIVFPDASAIDLGGMSGLDSHGNAGLRDRVDNHYKRLIGFAVLTSGFAAAMGLSQRQNASVLQTPSAGQTAAQAVGQQLAQLGVETTRRNLNIQPTIKVAVGYKFNVRVNRDVLFESPYSEPSH
jgi:type IV secretion system protein VirB10